MADFPRPVVVVSRCLEIEACRYNARIIRAPFITTLARWADLRPICPEVEIGLGTPRDPIRLVRIGNDRQLVQPNTGHDVTAAMQAFADDFLGSVTEADGFILKSRSPSCGIRDTKVYGGPDAEMPIGRDAGMFGRAVLDRFPHAAIEDEGRLTNFRLRHHFLVKLFTRAEFRAVRASGDMAELVRFHTEHTFQLMAVRESVMRELGRIVANPAQQAFDEVIAAYEAGLARALETPAKDPAGPESLARLRFLAPYPLELMDLPDPGRN